MNVKALIIEPDGSYRIEEIDAGLPSMQAVVGGFIEAVSPSTEPGWPGGHWHAYCNEEGKNNRLPANRGATVLAHAGGWPAGDLLVGPVVFLGPDPKGEGDEGDVPEELLTLWESVRMAVAAGGGVEYFIDVLPRRSTATGDSAIRRPTGERGGFSEARAFLRGEQA